MGATIKWNLVPDMTVVVLAAKELWDYVHLFDVLSTPDDVLLWHEPDYDDVLTAIAINPACELKWLASLPLLGRKGVK